MANIHSLHWTVLVVAILFCISVHLSTSFGSPLNPRKIVRGELSQCLIQYGVQESQIVEYDTDYPGEEYTKLNYQWNLLRSTKTPIAYLLVTGVPDIQAAVACAVSLSIRLVVKGGGHSYAAYSVGDNNSFIVDLQLLDELTVAADRQSFTVGAGALLGQIAWPLYEYHGLVTPHGTCPTVGIAGLALGGGYGYLSKLYGLTTDNVLELEVVTASGSVLTVNQYTEPDLFWAMRGAGSGNFGIVTKLTLKTYEPPQTVVTGTKIYELDQFPRIFEIWQRFVVDWYDSKEINTKMSIKDGQVIVELFDIQVGESEGTERMEQLLETFPGTATVNTTSTLASAYSDFIFHTSHPEDLGVTDPSQLPNVTRQSFVQRNFHAKSYFVPDLMTSESIWSLYFLLEETLNSIRGIILEFYAFGGVLSNPVPDNAFTHRDSNLYLVQAFYLDKAGLRPESLHWLNRFYETSERVTGHTESYQNYADPDLPDFLQRYYGSALPRLTEIKRAVDPNNVFNHPQSIPI